MKKKTKIKLILLLTVLFFTLICVYLAWSFKQNFPDAVNAYCDRVVVARMSEILNSALIEALEQENTEDILDIQKDENGNVVLITVDTEKVNLIKSRLTLHILETLQNEDRMRFGIPLGNVFASYILSGCGPEIPITVVPVGSVVSKTKSSFVSGGINQTKYELYVEFIMCVEIAAPFAKEAREVNGELCIAQTIIIGKSPNVIWGSDD